MIDIELIKLIIIEKLKPLNPEKIILFGSYAYGTPTKDSDLDICVVASDYTSKMEEKRKIREALKEINMAKDILVEKSIFFKEHTTDDWINTAWYDAAHYGTLLYEKK